MCEESRGKDCARDFVINFNQRVYSLFFIQRAVQKLNDCSQTAISEEWNSPVFILPLELFHKNRNLQMAWICCVCEKLLFFYFLLCFLLHLLNFHEDRMICAQKRSPQTMSGRLFLASWYRISQSPRKRSWAFIRYKIARYGRRKGVSSYEGFARLLSLLNSKEIWQCQKQIPPNKNGWAW